MNLLHLRYFVELAATQHYTRAAERLCITQPSLSHAMAQLETELGVPLFEKSGRGIVLTRFGRQFLACAQQTLGTLDAGTAELRRVGGGGGLIRLGLLRTLGVELVPGLAERFLRAHPDKDIRFTFQVDSTGALIERLAARELDMVFASRPPEKLRLTAETIGHQDLVLIVPRSHPLAVRTSIDLAETIPYPQIFFSRDAGLRGIIDDMFKRTGMRPEIAYETQEDQVIAGLVAHGFGIAVVPYMQLLEQLELQIIQIAQPAWECEFCLICDDDAYQTPAARSFRAFVLEQTAEMDGKGKPFSKST